MAGGFISSLALFGGGGVVLTSYVSLYSDMTAELELSHHGTEGKT